MKAAILKNVRKSGKCKKTVQEVVEVACHAVEPCSLGRILGKVASLATAHTFSASPDKTKIFLRNVRQK